MSGTSNVKYLSSSEQDTRWGLTVNTVGHQLIKPNSVYPSASHPFHYLFSPEKGRILNEYQLIYILDGKVTNPIKKQDGTNIGLASMDRT